MIDEDLLALADDREGFVEAAYLLVGVSEVQAYKREVVDQRGVFLKEIDCAKEGPDGLVVPGEGSLNLAEILQGMSAELCHHHLGIGVGRHVLRDHYL